MNYNPSWPDFGLTMNEKHKVNTLNDVYELSKKSDKSVYDVKEINFYGGRYKNYIKVVNKALEKGINQSPVPDFYIDIYMFIDKLMSLHIAPNIKYLPMIRTWCPSPSSGQHVWYYDSKKQKLEFLWAIPNKVDIISLSSQEHLLTTEDRYLLDSIYKFFNGYYLEVMKKRNKEIESNLKNRRHYG